MLAVSPIRTAPAVQIVFQLTVWITERNKTHANLRLVLPGPSVFSAASICLWRSEKKRNHQKIIQKRKPEHKLERKDKVDFVCFTGAVRSDNSQNLSWSQLTSRQTNVINHRRAHRFRSNAFILQTIDSQTAATQ